VRLLVTAARTPAGRTLWHASTVPRPVRALIPTTATKFRDRG